MKKIILISVIVLVPILMCAEIFGKVGTAGLQFLKLGIDARATGMGEAYIAVSDDISSVYWNPAGLATKLEHQAFFSHTEWPAEIKHEFAAVSFTDGIQALGLSASVLHMDDMDETTEEFFGPTGRTFTNSDIALGLTYSNAFTDKFAFGITGKYLRQNLSEFSIDSYAFDIGSLYNTQWKNFTIGMTLRNFGPDFIYEIDNDGDGLTDEDPFDLLDNDGDGLIDEDGPELGFKIPMSFSLGVSMELINYEEQVLLIAAQLDNVVDREETWNIGSEYLYRNFALRAGYQIGYDAASYSFGAGFKVPTRMAIFNLDYAYTDMGDLTENFINGVHRFSVKMSF
ncbi:PorV/PorQ family protein [bacterium]|nr:PorV/PorQ family protein [bacterium]